ncbi:ATP-binding cassette domain-containing protein [Mycobacterium sp. IS-1496]|uniref:ATP-binding cassette domain-containing protein n=1 Tax=Mycobacterium sp. IS-1496 TaxID=1772284 RepID=UPI0015617A66|nr:ATP-binding cassette domain-containing protein [Mycobacterium sp. IS-1496]
MAQRFTVASNVFEVTAPGKLVRMHSPVSATHSNPTTPSKSTAIPEPRGVSDFPSPLNVWQLPPNTRLTIGREGGPAEIQLRGLDLAQQHATVAWTGRAVEIRSLSSQARPFVNGQPVLHARIPVGAQFMLGNHTLSVTAPAQIALVPVLVGARGPLLRFTNVSLRYKSRSEATLKNLSFEMAGGEVLAIIGPSGAGKSTMCGGLLGEVGLESGEMMLGQANLSVANTQASHLVSFVPQQPAMFGNLCVRESLTWVARLRLAADVDPREGAERVAQVIAAMELTNEVQKRIDELSGGQRKRVSTAMELLSDPLLLVLDEPTSGLDEGLDRKMMDSLRSSARDEGRAVIVVTHSMVNIDRADRVLALTRRGQLAYFGSPAELLHTFGANNYAEVMDLLRADRVTEARPQISAASLSNSDVAAAPPRRGSLARHLPYLVGREFARQRNNAGQLAASLGVGVLLTALLSAAASGDGLAGNPRGISSMLIAFIVCLTFFSMAQSFAAIVDDRDTIERESRWSISATSMVLARAIACAPLAVTLGILSTLLYLVLKRRDPIDPVLPHPLGLLIFAVTLPLTAMTIGLLISAVSKSLRQAVFILMGVLALQVVMTGLAPPFEGAAGEVMKVLAYFTPSRWSSAGLGANHGITRSFYVDPGTGKPLAAGESPDALSQVQPSPFQDAIWSHDASHVYLAAAALIVMGLTALIATALVLRRQLMAPR